MDFFDQQSCNLQKGPAAALGMWATLHDDAILGPVRTPRLQHKTPTADQLGAAAFTCTCTYSTVPPFQFRISRHCFACLATASRVQPSQQQQPVSSCVESRASQEPCERSQCVHRKDGVILKQPALPVALLDSPFGRRGGATPPPDRFALCVPGRALPPTAGAIGATFRYPAGAAASRVRYPKADSWTSPATALAVPGADKGSWKLGWGRILLS